MKECFELALDELRAIEGYCPDHFDENEQVQIECAQYLRDHYRTVRIALEQAAQNRAKQNLSNTEILMFIIGWQGGTIGQLADAMGVPEWRILNADYDDMQDLMRLAQQKRAAQSNNGWMPIETAPRDKRVLVRTENEIYAAHWAKNMLTDDEAWIVAEWGDEGDQALVKPIEWMHLPTPPRAAESAGKGGV